jgi:hypothetical protein
MLNDLLIWVALLVGLILLVVDKRRGIGALTLGYFLDLSLGHVPGLLVYLDPDMLFGHFEATKVGFDMTVIGMTAFVVGAMAARILWRLTTSGKAPQQTVKADIFAQHSWRVFMIGIGSYFVLLPVSAFVPSLTAVASVLGTLLILGFWLQLYASTNSRRRLLIVAALPLLPLATLATGGFIGFGTVWALSILAFLFVISRRRIWFYLATPIVLFLGISLFVTYFQQREDIREVVGNQSSSFLDRFEKISILITDFQILDLSNERHLTALDVRLNQNYLVGEGVARHQAGDVELLYGATVPLWALIPRAIWPDKPAVGGGGNLVEDFTAIRFSEGTSVGAGQVLEFYMNFGTAGVVLGFAVLGFILMRIDQAVMRAFSMRSIYGVTIWILPGLALLQPLGNLMEILVAVVTAIITSLLIARLKLLGLDSTRKRNVKMSLEKIQVIGRR